MSYQIERHPGCVLFFGSVPIQALSCEAEPFGDDGVLDTDVARVCGASLAIGTRVGLDVVRVQRLPRYRQKVESFYANHELSEGAVDWLVGGEQGRSSLALFHALAGVPPMPPAEGFEPAAHPLDPDDFRRCLKMLEAAPELASRLQEAKRLSPCWAALINHWGDLVRALEVEVPDWQDFPGRAGQTAELMRELISDA